MAMANVIGKKAAIGKIYNVQDAQSVTFEGLAKLCVHARGSPLFTHALSHLSAERDYHPHIVAITGTNGKTTVTTLTSLLLKSAGMHVAMAGNIGPSLLDTLRDNLDNLPKALVL